MEQVLLVVTWVQAVPLYSPWTLWARGARLLAVTDNCKLVESVSFELRLWRLITDFYGGVADVYRKKPHLWAKVRAGTHGVSRGCGSPSRAGACWTNPADLLANAVKNAIRRTPLCLYPHWRCEHAALLTSSLCNLQGLVGDLIKSNL